MKDETILITTANGLEVPMKPWFDHQIMEAKRYILQMMLQELIEFKDRWESA